LLAVDTIPDVFATVGNVSADLTANSIVANGERESARGEIESARSEIESVRGEPVEP